MNCELMAIHGTQGCGAKVNVEHSNNEFVWTLHIRSKPL
jgi:hypothetical protein